VVCQSCGVPLGIIQVINGVELLRTGNTLARALYGSCAICGAEVHWSIGDRALSKLVQHALEIGRDGV
jgi:hypothetical protein